MNSMELRNITRSQETTNSDGTVNWTETMKEPGSLSTRTVTAEAWDVEVTDCFCCTCPENGSSDPHCRNHGGAGSRPCEKHGQPGTAYEGVMPHSVQHRLSNK